jgi:hypothetical protein
MELDLNTVLRISVDDIVEAALSVPSWSELVRPPHNAGFVRHGVPKAVDSYGRDHKPAYEKHAEPFLARAVGGLVQVGVRNAGQNLLLPAFDVRRSPRLLARSDEPWRTEEYFALVGLPGNRRSIERVRFRGDDDGVVSIERRTADGAWTPCDAEFAVVGQPLLCDGVVPSWEEIVGRTYDLRHVWRLHWESHQGNPSDARIHAGLMEILMEHLDRPAAERGRMLIERAGLHGLQVETGFYHSTAGITDAGDLVFLAGRGSLTDLGRAQKEQGARSAVLLDNGGSVGYLIWTPTAPGRPAGVGCNSYFRPNAHALLTLVLKSRFLEAPFRPASAPRLADIVEIEPLPPETPRNPAPVHVIEARLRRNADAFVDVTFGNSGGGALRLPIHPPGSADYELSLHFAAAKCQNRCVITGARTVRIASDDTLVSDLRRVFEARFCKADFGKGWESGSVSDYLSVYNGAPFAITAADRGDDGPPAATETAVRSGGRVRPGAAVGVDIGNQSFKVAVVAFDEADGFELKSTKVFRTRPEGGAAALTSGDLLDRVEKAVRECCTKADVELDAVVGIGIAWPGAVRDGRIAATSNLFRELSDVFDLSTKRLIPEGLTRVIGLRTTVSERFGGKPTELVNDGSAAALYWSRAAGLKSAVVVVLGTSVAGGYVNGRGEVGGLLTEFGRCVIDLDRAAPPHFHTRIRGLARSLVGTEALAASLNKAMAGREGLARTVFDKENAGREACAVLAAGDAAAAAVVRRELEVMGRNLGVLLIEIRTHIPEAEHFVIGGGLAGTAAGRIITARAERDLAATGCGWRLETGRADVPDRFIGAVGAAMYVRRQA